MNMVTIAKTIFVGNFFVNENEIIKCLKFFVSGNRA